MRWLCPILMLMACNGQDPGDPVPTDVDTDTDTDADTDTDTDVDTDVVPPVEITLRLNDVEPPALVLDLDKSEVQDLFGPVAEDVLLLEVDSTPLLESALSTIKNACGTDWQLPNADPNHDCSQTSLGQTFVGTDGTWQTSAEYNLVRLLTMTPANSVVEGTSIEELRAVADFLGLGGGFSQILAESLLLDVDEEFLTTDVVIPSLQRNLLGSHPNIGSDGALPITLADALQDLAPMGTTFGPSGGHPGALDPSEPVYGEVLTSDFNMHVEAQSNLRVLDGVDLSAGKDYLAAVVDTTGPTYDDAAEFDFADPDAFYITGVADDPTVDLRFRIVEDPSFVPACTGTSACQGSLPGSPQPNTVWALDPWTLEYIVADAGLDKYSGLTNSVSYYLLGFIWSATVDIGQGGDPAGWANFSVLLDIGNPPDAQYTWELINEVAQVGMHQTPFGTFVEGDANPAFTLQDVPVGLVGSEVEEAVRPYLQDQSSEIAGFIFGNYKENSGPVDFYFRRLDDGTPALFWVTAEDRPDGLDYPWSNPGFFADSGLSTKVSDIDLSGSSDATHEKWAVKNGETVLFAQSEEGDVYQVRVIAPSSGEPTELTVLVSPP